MANLTSKQLADINRRLGLDPVTGGAKANKYNAKKKSLDGHLFDSTKEARKYQELRVLQYAGAITTLDLQPEYVLQGGFRDAHGKWQRPIRYRADFRVVWADGREEIIDVKSKATRTAMYLMKIKMLRRNFPEVNFVEAM